MGRHADAAAHGMIDVLIIEDEPAAARRLASIFQRHLPQVRLRQSENVDAARIALAENTADILCLDLNLHGADGFEVLASLTNQCQVIVVSAHTERALEAFDHGVVDFVAKPVSEARLTRAIDRALQHRQSSIKAIPLRTIHGIELVALAEIVSASALEDYSEVKTTGDQTYVEDQSLALLERRAGGNLLRIHRSHLVNPEHVREISTKSGALKVYLSNDTALPVSRRRASAIKATLRGQSEQ